MFWTIALLGTIVHDMDQPLPGKPFGGAGQPQAHAYAK
ncbi:hypothetical protein PATSB16_19450 [Pandoraea thiooxydans]|nr:hypothetical protein PATSB16_19450 [Pandoraea thiooxydans]